VGTAAIAMIALALPAAACDCMTPPPVKEALRQSAAVFAAVAESVKVDFSPTNEFGAGPTAVKMRVTRSWKGPRAKTAVIVHTGMGGGDCGYPMRAGARYLVYARRLGNGGLSTSICSRTDSLPNARPDSLELERRGRSAR